VSNRACLNTENFHKSLSSQPAMDVTRPTGVCFSRRWGGGCECGAPSIGVSRLGVVEIRSGVYCAESNVYLTINVLWLCVTAILVSLPSLPRRTGLFSGFCAEPEPASSIFKCHFTLDSLWSSASCQCFPWITVSFLDYVSLNLLLIGTFLAFFWYVFDYFIVLFGRLLLRRVRCFFFLSSSGSIQ
jgi:hypothetical protein